MLVERVTSQLNDHLQLAGEVARGLKCSLDALSGLQRRYHWTYIGIYNGLEFHRSGEAGAGRLGAEKAWAFTKMISIVRWRGLYQSGAGDASMVMRSVKSLLCPGWWLARLSRLLGGAVNVEKSPPENIGGLWMLSRPYRLLAGVRSAGHITNRSAKYELDANAMSCGVCPVELWTVLLAPALMSNCATAASCCQRAAQCRGVSSWMPRSFTSD